MLPMLPFLDRFPQPHMLPQVLCDALLAARGRSPAAFCLSDVLVDLVDCKLGAGLFDLNTKELGDVGCSSKNCILPGDASDVLSASASESWIDAFQVSL